MSLKIVPPPSTRQRHYDALHTNILSIAFDLFILLENELTKNKKLIIFHKIVGIYLLKPLACILPLFQTCLKGSLVPNFL